VLVTVLRSCLVALVVLLSACGIILQSETETPDDFVYVTPDGTSRYRLRLDYRIEGRGGNVHQPNSLSSYTRKGQDVFVVGSLIGRIEASNAKLVIYDGLANFAPPLRGYLLFGEGTVLIDVEYYQRVSESSTEWRPYKLNGQYRLKTP